MTGYGLGSRKSGQVSYTAEIKSLNSKFLELSLKVPKAFSDKELTLRSDCNRLIERGKVSVVITAEYPDAQVKAASINRDLLRTYYKELKAVAGELGDAGEGLLKVALNFPEVIGYDEDAVSDEEWQQFYGAFQDALADFNRFRSDEGGVLQQDLILRIEIIRALLVKVEVLEPNRIPQIRERLSSLLAEYIGKENVDNNRFEQELIYYIDKLDITEEKVRLRSHCDYFLAALAQDDAGGKKLGFISQEIGREINTMGSKANDAGIQQLVVGMKEELEKIKEQLLNVL